MSDRRSGQCLCGKVRIEADFPKTGFQACHCVQCQRWTGGGPFLAIRAHNLEISGEDNVESYCHSSWGERANCQNCGSILWWKMQGKPPAFVAVGLLVDQSDLTLTEEIFVDHRPAWLKPEDGASQSTEAEQVAQLNAYLEKQK
jgi:hypothetical protein